MTNPVPESPNEDRNEVESAITTLAAALAFLGQRSQGVDRGALYRMEATGYQNGRGVAPGRAGSGELEMELRVLPSNRFRPQSVRAAATEIMVETRNRLRLSTDEMAVTLEEMLGEPVTSAQVRAYENPRCIPPGDVLMASLLLLSNCLGQLVS